MFSDGPSLPFPQGNTILLGNVGDSAAVLGTDTGTSYTARWGNGRRGGYTHKVGVMGQPGSGPLFDRDDAYTYRAPPRTLPVHLRGLYRLERTLLPLSPALRFPRLLTERHNGHVPCEAQRVRGTQPGAVEVKDGPRGDGYLQVGAGMGKRGRTGSRWVTWGHTWAVAQARRAPAGGYRDGG